MQKKRPRPRMTIKEFEERFLGVISPICRGVKYPRFRRLAINESRFEDGCRYKEYRFLFHEETQSVELYWVSQESCVNHSLFDAELIRCFKEVGGIGEIHVSLRDRDWLHKFEYDLSIGK